MVKLRDYQVECIDVIAKKFKTTDRQLIQLPTGAGKTWVFLSYLANHSKRALIVCPSIELKEQIVETGKSFLGKDAISFGVSSAPFAVVTSKALNSATGNWDHVVIDEAHHAQANSYRKYLDNHNGFKLLGCTATPERKDKKCLLEIFGEISFSRNIVDLIKQGHLCDVEAYRIKTGIEIDTHRVKYDDFTAVQLKELDKESRNKIIIKTFLDNCIKYKTLIFCLNIEHSLNIAMMLKDKGIRAEAIHGEMSKDKRQDILKRFKKGETQALTNCQLLTEGFDEPSIEALLITRPTRSKTLYCQMIGRGLRNFPGKDLCRLYELTDNSYKLCNFAVAADFESGSEYEYKDGCKLTNARTEIQKISVDDVKLQKEKFSLFEPNFWDGPAFATQHVDIPGDSNELTFKEAAFLIWKDKLKRKYGYN